MTLTSRRRLTVFFAIASIPCIFLACFRGWIMYEHFLASFEVLRFIRDHEALVHERLTDPKVHSFSLTRDPAEAGVLVIAFDVEDKATYEMLENDLDEHWGLRIPARWNTRLRSREELGNNYGFAALGIGMVMQALIVMSIAAGVSVVLPMIYLFFALRKLRPPPPPDATAIANGWSD